MLRDFLATGNHKINKGQPITPQSFNRLLKGVDNEFERQLLTEQILRSQMQAYYGGEPLGHFGLSLRSYSHFTSPIRRYADLITHRALIEAAQLPATKAERKAPSYANAAERKKALNQLGERLSQKERRAVSAERMTVDRYIAAFLMKRVGDIFDCTISSVKDFGFFVTIQNIGGDGIVPLSTLYDDFYHYHQAEQKLVGERSGRVFVVGMAIRLRLDEAEPISGAYAFRFHKMIITFKGIVDHPYKSSGII